MRSFAALAVRSAAALAVRSAAALAVRSAAALAVGSAAALAVGSAAVLAVALWLPAAAHAAAPEGKVFDDWRVECEQAEGQTSRCFASQTQTLEEQNARLLRISLGPLGPKGEPMIILQLPLGIDLRVAPAIKVDDGQAATILQQCTQDGCIAAGIVDPASLKKLLSAKDLRVGLRPYGRADTVVIPVSVNGLKAAWDSLK